MNWNFSSNHVEHRGLPLGRLGAGWLVCAHSRCSPLKQVNSLRGPLILVMSVWKIRIDLD